MALDSRGEKLVSIWPRIETGIVQTHQSALNCRAGFDPLASLTSTTTSASLWRMRTTLQSYSIRPLTLRVRAFEIMSMPPTGWNMVCPYS